jgi:hypothetical protein
VAGNEIPAGGKASRLRAAPPLRFSIEKQKIDGVCTSSFEFFQNANIIFIVADDNAKSRAWAEWLCRNV